MQAMREPKATELGRSATKITILTFIVLEVLCCYARNGLSFCFVVAFRFLLLNCLLFVNNDRYMFMYSHNYRHAFIYVLACVCVCLYMFVSCVCVCVLMFQCVCLFVGVFVNAHSRYPFCTCISFQYVHYYISFIQKWKQVYMVWCSNIFFFFQSHSYEHTIFSVTRQGSRVRAFANMHLSFYLKKEEKCISAHDFFYATFTL